VAAEYVDPLAPPRRFADDTHALRVAAAFALADDVTVARALLAGRPVPAALLDKQLLARLPLWGGFLDDAAALDVAIALKALQTERAAAAAPATWTPAPPARRRPTLAQLDALPVDVEPPRKRRRR